MRKCISHSRFLTERVPNSFLEMEQRLFSMPSLPNWLTFRLVFEPLSSDSCTSRNWRGSIARYTRNTFYPAPSDTLRSAIPITITPSNSQTTGYPVSLQFDHASLVTAGKSVSSGNDVAIYYSATGDFTHSQVEVDRQRDPLSSWNTASTKIWFKLQAGISSADSTHYRIYYGSSSYQAKSDNVFTDTTTSGSEQTN